LPFGQVHTDLTFGDNECWITGQIWTDNPLARWVFALPPGRFATISGFRGGTAWFLSGRIANIEAELQKQVRDLEARQPGIPTHIIVLPRDSGKFPVLIRFN
jgi:hypothetical protein